ncbi:MAG: hypothetical protein V1775_17855 [Bacteroidota bacterium]
MMLRKIGTIVLLFTGLMVHAQYSGEPFSPYTVNSGFTENGSLSSLYRFNLQTGAFFNSGIGGGSLFNSFIAPSFSKDLGKKFTLSAGAVISNTTYTDVSMYNSEGTFKPYSGNLTNLTLYAAGTYQVNERLSVTGSAFRTINPAFNARLNPEKLRMEAQGMSFGVGYKVSDNVHIGAEIRYQQGNSNIYSPYGIQGNSPFMNNGIVGY